MRAASRRRRSADYTTLSALALCVPAAQKEARGGLDAREPGEMQLDGSAAKSGTEICESGVYKNHAGSGIILHGERPERSRMVRWALTRSFLRSAYAFSTSTCIEYRSTAQHTICTERWVPHERDWLAAGVARL